MSIRKDGAWVKQQRIQKMHAMLNGVAEVSLSRFLATCSYQMGLSKETARQYLKDLVDLGFIEIDEAGDRIREVVKE